VGCICIILVYKGLCNLTHVKKLAKISPTIYQSIMWIHVYNGCVEPIVRKNTYWQKYHPKPVNVDPASSVKPMTIWKD
jgi:inosine-uridine nucleoside N-ribohydrolase